MFRERFKNWKIIMKMTSGFFYAFNIYYLIYYVYTIDFFLCFSIKGYFKFVYWQKMWFWKKFNLDKIFKLFKFREIFRNWKFLMKRTLWLVFFCSYSLQFNLLCIYYWIFVYVFSLFFYKRIFLIFILAKNVILEKDSTFKFK